MHIREGSAAAKRDQAEKQRPRVTHDAIFCGKAIKCPLTTYGLRYESVAWLM
jgi:hypothetical protein